MEQEFFRTTNQKILLYLMKEPNKYKSKIFQDMKLSYSSVINSLNILKEKGLVTLTKDGRNVNVTLTPRGIQTAQLLAEAKINFNGE